MFALRQVTMVLDITHQRRSILRPLQFQGRIKPVSGCGNGPQAHYRSWIWHDGLVTMLSEFRHVKSAKIGLTILSQRAFDDGDFVIWQTDRLKLNQISFLLNRGCVQLGNLGMVRGRNRSCDDVRRRLMAYAIMWKPKPLFITRLPNHG
jgi:hypothetical protein